MNQHADTTEKIHAFILRKFPHARKRGIGMTDSLLDGGIIDSMGTLEVVDFLEQSFGVVITDEEMVADHFESVTSIASLVTSKNNSGSAETF